MAKDMYTADTFQRSIHRKVLIGVSQYPQYSDLNLFNIPFNRFLRVISHHYHFNVNNVLGAPL